MTAHPELVEAFREVASEEANASPRTPGRPRLAAHIRFPSSADPTIKYMVVVNPSGAITCNCAAGWHRRPCRHARMVAS
jgi:hypothetical protein